MLLRCVGRDEIDCCVSQNIHKCKVKHNIPIDLLKKKASYVTLNHYLHNRNLTKLYINYVLMLNYYYLRLHVFLSRDGNSLGLIICFQSVLYYLLD